MLHFLLILTIVALVPVAVAAVRTYAYVAGRGSGDDLTSRMRAQLGRDAADYIAGTGAYAPALDLPRY